MIPQQVFLDSDSDQSYSGNGTARILIEENSEIKGTQNFLQLANRKVAQDTEENRISFDQMTSKIQVRKVFENQQQSASAGALEGIMAEQANFRNNLATSTLEPPLAS